MPTLPLLLTTDDLLLDEVLRVASAAGTDVYTCDTGPDAAARWVCAPVVLAGADALARVACLGWPRRPGVIVVARSADGDDPVIWRGAVAVGAEHVAALPEADRWLVERLSDLSDTTGPPARVVTVVAGRGGAGATSYATLLARAYSGDALLIDIDPLSGGIDLRADLHDVAGVRWPDLAAVSGRLSPSALRGALPRDRNLAVISSTGADPGRIPIDSCAAVVDAAVRGGGLVVIDCPRALDPVSRLVWARSDLVVVVVADDPSALPAAHALFEALHSAGCRTAAVFRRGRESVLHGLDVADALGVPVVAQWRHDRALARGDSSGLARSRSWRSVTQPVLDLLDADDAPRLLP
ncbi:MAG: septum formation initiator [Actinobacteria bacterium]|nr:septum formation initiator [Actinomycetota bacterium]